MKDVFRSGNSTKIFFFQAEDGIRDWSVTGVQTCALPICRPLYPLSGLFLLRGPRFLGQGAPGLAGCRSGQRAAAHPQGVSALADVYGQLDTRSEERRVGKECRSWMAR